jgi:hypothetical protein
LPDLLLKVRKTRQMRKRMRQNPMMKATARKNITFNALFKIMIKTKLALYSALL